jgi:hypothetical protein
MSKSVLAGMFIVLCILVIAAGCTGQQGSKAVVKPTVTIAVPSAGLIQSGFQALPQAPLNDTERADIIQLQEEEKLVHDLNAALATQHPDVPIFQSIANASQVYMTADNVILQRYGIPNPEMDAAGKFTNQKFQQMYDQGVNTGSLSAMDALLVDATLEDMHIADLGAAIGRTDNTDVQFIYQQELAASRNNLRAISQWITAYGGVFKPTYISVDYYNSMMNTPVQQVLV